MLALSCLDSLAAMDDASIFVLNYMSAHGYIRHLLDGLVQADGALTATLDPNEPLRQLYIYESTMSLLTRLAMTSQGAAVLLRSGLMARLAECGVYDSRPTITTLQ